MKKTWLIAFFALLSLAFVFPAHAYTYDLGLNQAGIFFSKSRLIAGDTIRIYARITNYGEEDVAAYVSFHKGAEKIKDSQVVSVRAGGLADEVYVDFVVPIGSFNIRAEIKGQDPGDENLANDVAVTTMFYPEIDDDQDGIPNDDDNCPNSANADQKDSDNDGQGDACDTDDDNDGWSDQRERDEGTSPTSPDTDQDGYQDPIDDYPLDPSKHEPEPAPTAEPEPQEPALEPSNQQPDIEPPAEEPVNPEEEPDEIQAVATQEAEIRDAYSLKNLQLSPHASFSYRRIKWNQYEFQALGAMRKNLRYEWDFGDGATDNQEKVMHAFSKSGEYKVRLTVIDLTGQTDEDEVTIRISFFNLDNWQLWVLVAVMALAAIVVPTLLGWISMVKHRKWESSQNENE